MAGEEEQCRRKSRDGANVINNKSKLVFANVDNCRISFELRSELKPESLVLFVDDPEWHRHRC